jgi:hypothetical protein
MKITLTPEESEEYFYNALCNVGYLVNSAGCEIDWHENDYDAAKQTLTSAHPDRVHCLEDVLMQMLREGGELLIKDLEGDGDQDSVILLKHIHENVMLAPERDLLDMREGNDDACTAWNIIQQVAYNEIIFG